ncbi:MAG: RdgB/HAM1 family non-canonical purine NTP pyrophosphatase [Terriglobales bacterium]
MARILVASSNQGKLRDFAAVAAPYSIEIAGIPGFNDLPDVVEDAPTFETNAQKKAEHYSRYAPGEYVLADDSGLEVDALHGAPGIFSARYASTPNHPNATDAENNAKLVHEMAGIPEDSRQARFVCAIAVARDGRTVATFRGCANGVIQDEPRGTGGFGYDPLFCVTSLKKTFAELTPEEKAQVSHRGEAFRKLLQWMLDSDER